jgi:hypothetical protein
MKRGAWEDNMNLIGRLSQEQIVFGLAVLLCLAFTIFVPGFLTTNNLVNLVRSVSILGILGVAMGIVVIGVALFCRWWRSWRFRWPGRCNWCPVACP